MDYSILVPEIRDDPLSRGYAGMTDAEVAESLNGTLDRTMPDPVRKSNRDLMARYGLSVAGTIYTKLKDAAATKPAVTIALTAMDDYSDGGGIDFSHAQLIAGIDALVAAGDLTADEGDKLKAMGFRMTSRAEELGLGKVGSGHVDSARRRIAGEPLGPAGNLG